MYEIDDNHDNEDNLLRKELFLLLWLSLKPRKVMADKKTKSFILRVDSDTMNAIEAWAADEFRSTNGQLQWIINEALRKSGRLKAK